MSDTEIINVVLVELGVFVPKNSLNRDPKNQDAKRIAVVLLFEEGYKHSDIGRILNRDRSLIYRDLKVADDHLNYNRTFKKKYLACIKRIADMEEKAV